MPATVSPTFVVGQLRAFLEGKCPPSDALNDALAMLDALPRTIEGPTTLRTWMQAHDGQRVDTLQVQHGRTWAPVGRTVDASRATYVTLSGSRRDYRGLHIVCSDARSIVVQGTSDGESTTIVYSLSEG